MPFLRRKQKTSFEGGGLVLFRDVQDAIRTKRCLRMLDMQLG